MFLLLAPLFFIPTLVSADCAISTNGDLGEPQPLIVNLDHTIRHPQTDDVVSFYTNETLILSCPGSYLQVALGAQKLNFSEHENVTCAYSKQFSIGNVTVIFYNITCAKYPYHVARSTGNSCEGNNQEIEIGFTVQSTYIRHLQICFDNKTHTTLYSHLQQLPSIRGRQSGFPRPSWINDDFYQLGGNASNKDANSLLVRASQIETLSKLVGHNSSTDNPYVNYTADLYLARGHLVAKADFVYGAQQRATFHMVNAAPQWQTFNGRNWAYAEADARNLASNYNLTLEVYTGTYGVMTLPHLQTGKDVDIYMYSDDKNNTEYPTPLLFWKYLYDPITKAGIVLVGVNNPYIKNVSKAVFCKDIYSSINWTTTFSRNDILNGYMYACAPDELLKTVTYMPNLPLKYLLTLNYTYNTTHNISTTGSATVVICNSFVLFFGLYLLAYM